MFHFFCCMYHLTYIHVGERVTSVRLGVLLSVFRFLGNAVAFPKFRCLFGDCNLVPVTAGQAFYPLPLAFCGEVRCTVRYHSSGATI